jgi:HEAT repeat protein
LRRGFVARALALALGQLGCEDVTHRDIGDEINILVRRDDQLVAPATERLAAYKRAAIPQLETALHTAAPTGRLHLLAALDRIGDGEAAPVLRHVAIYDVTPEIRRAAEELLSRWASSTPPARAASARAALAEIARHRAAGDGPLLFGDAGIPGVPTTVGAPEPVGVTPKK